MQNTARMFYRYVPICLQVTLLVALLITGTLAVNPAQAAAPDYVTNERPPPTSAVDSPGLLTEGFEDKEQPPPPYDRRRKQLEAQFPLLRDSRVSIKPRTYYFDRQRETGDDSVAWALGGSIDYHSGWWRDRLRAGAVLYTSQKLYGPEDEDGTKLLLPGQKSFTVFGEAYIEAKLTRQIRAQLGRTTFNLPYLNKNDGRMVPGTFESLGLEGKFGRKANFILAQVWKMKERDSDEFVYMSEAAGYEGTREPVTLAAAQYSITDRWNLGMANQYGNNFANTLYAETNAAWQLPLDTALSTSFQYTNQQSVGNALGGEFNTYVVGGKASASYRRAVLSVAFSSTGAGADISNPFGGYPGYLSLMINNFNRAEEDAWLVGLSYNFKELGLPGLSFFTNYAVGVTPDRGRNASPDQNEWDVTFDYRFQSPALNKLWLRLRWASLDQSGPGAVDVDDTRIILNYDWRLL